MEALYIVTGCCRMLQNVTEHCRMLRNITEHYRALWDVTEHYGSIMGRCGALQSRWARWQIRNISAYARLIESDVLISIELCTLGILICCLL